MGEPRVIIEQRLLRDSGDNGALQRIALVYLGAQEHRVYAPSRASGKPVDWREQLDVRIHAGYGEMSLPEPDRGKIIAIMFQELDRSATETAKAEADAFYCEAQICVQGDVQSFDGMPFDPSAHCTKCGSKCIHQCLSCGVPIRGNVKYSADVYRSPSFCHGCGKPYPWMEDKLNVAHELLFHDDQLTYEERKELWSLLQYVMSNPKADLVPGKLKLISIKIQKAAAPFREFMIDFLAKVVVDISK